MNKLGYILNKDIVNKAGKPPKIRNLLDFLVWKFIKEPSTFSSEWPRELKIAKGLLKEYPEVDFWNFVDLRFKLNSLAWFLTEDGKLFLKKEKNRKEFIKETNNQPIQEEIKLEEKPLGEDICIAQKPKTLLDFIKKK